VVEPCVQPLDEFVLDHVLVDELPGTEDNGEIDARVAERVIPDEWLECRHAAGNVCHDSATHVHDNAFDVREIARVVDTAIHLGTRDRSAAAMTCPITQLATTVMAVQASGRPHADQSLNSFIFDSFQRWRVTRDDRSGHSDADSCTIKPNLRGTGPSRPEPQALSRKVPSPSADAMAMGLPVS
jgi:hypothetical protein